jgi:hypothetical protein
MFVCNSPKFIFVSVTKSGSSSIIDVLKSNFTGQALPRRPIIPKQYNKHFSFCTVRNPYARMVSWWWSVCKMPGDRYHHKAELAEANLPPTLLGFLTLWKMKGDYSQSRYIEVNNGISQILKLENIEEDFNTLPFMKKHVTIPTVNSKKHPPWTELLDEESGKTINQHYKKDFENFKYEMINYD